MDIERMQQIIFDLLQHNTPNLKSEEERQFRREVAQEIEEASKTRKDLVVDLQPDLPDIGR